jgi:hypothetical protein
MLHRLWYRIALMLIDGNTLLIDMEIKRYEYINVNLVSNQGHKRDYFGKNNLINNR